MKVDWNDYKAHVVGMVKHQPEVLEFWIRLIKSLNEDPTPLRDAEKLPESKLLCLMNFAAVGLIEVWEEVHSSVDALEALKKIMMDSEN